MLFNPRFLETVNRLRSLRGMPRLYWRQARPWGPPCGGAYICGGCCPDCFA